MFMGGKADDFMKVMQERLECDVCRAEAVRYTLTLPDGMKVLDRCARHATAIFALKDEPGEWHPSRSREGITVLKPRDVQELRRKQ
jgi:hypothetical protein